MGNHNPANKRECIGEQFGRLKVISEVPTIERKSNVRELICLCECGNTVRVRSSNLFSGNTTSCGCLAKEKTSQRSKKEVIGKRFGRLVVIKELESRNKKRRVLCRCDCGNEKDIAVGSLLNGRIKSCGCYRSEKIKELYTEDLTGQTYYTSQSAWKRLV